MNWYGLAFVVGTVVVWFWLRSLRSPRRRRPSDRFAKLVALCHTDRAMAERLVAAEARRNPGRPQRDLVERAIDRLMADRRR